MEPRTKAKETKVLYLAGAGRSGSTLLGRLFAEPPQAVHVGELVYLWRRGFAENHLCGCGVPFLECPFWSEVFARGFGGFDGVDPPDILETKRQRRKQQQMLLMRLMLMMLVPYPACR